MSKPQASPRCAGRDEFRLDAVHRGAIHFARNWLSGKYGIGDAAAHPSRPLPMAGHAGPHQLGRALAAAWPSCRQIFAAELPWTKSTMRRQLPPARRFHNPAQPADAGIAADAGHLGEISPAPPMAARA